MLSKKEKIISSILCVISVVLLIASLCFTTLLFTTHGTILKAEAAPDISSDTYNEYFSEYIYPNGFSFSIDETSFESISFGYSARQDLENYSSDPLRLDIAYRCNVGMSDGTDLYVNTVVFFPSIYNTDGTLYYGFGFYVETCFIEVLFFSSHILVDIHCDDNYFVDAFALSGVPSLTVSSFYSSFESLYESDGWGVMSTGYFDNGVLDYFYLNNTISSDDFNYPCFLMLESNVGNLLVYYTPSLLPNGLYYYRLVGIPNSFYTYCQFNDSPTQECFVSLDSETFDEYFVFEFNDIHLVAPVPLNQAPIEDDPPIHETLGEVLLQGMSFGFDSIGDGITYVVNNLFFDDLGNLSNFTYVIVFTLGIGIVLGFIKWILSYIFSLGGKD